MVADSFARALRMGAEVFHHLKKVLKARKLQGQYMGALRTLSGTARARVKAVAKDKDAASKSRR